MNYYEHHIGDYDANTAHLSWLEDMAYTRLLRLYYRKESQIPADIAQACRLVRATSKDERKAVETVLHEYFELREDGWHQCRCDEEIAKYQSKCERNREVGKKGGRPRKTETQTEPTENPDGFQNKTQTEPTENPPQTPDPNTSPSLRSGEGRASRLPLDWTLPDPWREWAFQERPDLDPALTAAKFADYWHAKAGQAGRKLDWLATWRNWVREEKAPTRVAQRHAHQDTLPAWRRDEIRRQFEATPNLVPAELLPQIGIDPATRRPFAKPASGITVIDTTAKEIGHEPARNVG